MNTHKALSTLALAFSLVATACATGGNRTPRPSDLDPTIRQVDDACRMSDMSRARNVRDCYNAVRESDDAFRAKVGTALNLNRKELELVSHHCQDSQNARNEAATSFSTARGDFSNGYIFGSVVKYFRALSQCEDVYAQSLRQAGKAELADVGNAHARQASLLASMMENRARRPQ